MPIGNLEQKIIRVESLLIGLAIVAIAGGDYMLGERVSLGYLYLIPLSYSALVHRLGTTLGLTVLCVVLRQWLGPVEYSSYTLIIRDWVLTGVFLVVVAALQRLGNQRRQFFEEARRQRDDLVAEVKLAARVQQQLLSRNLPPNRFEIGARTAPARVVGGDYYDFVCSTEGQICFVIADVSGKGLSAALLMPAVQIVLRTLAKRRLKTTAIVKELDTVLYEALEGERYVTLWYGCLDLATGRLEYVNCGHQPALLVAADSGDITELRTGGLPVGLLSGGDFQAGETPLKKGDLLFLYTDGIVEARDGTEEFGLERLHALVRESTKLAADQIVDRVHRAIDEFSAGSPQADDMTVIVVKSPGPESRSET